MVAVGVRTNACWLGPVGGGCLLLVVLGARLTGGPVGGGCLLLVLAARLTGGPVGGPVGGGCLLLVLGARPTAGGWLWANDVLLTLLTAAWSAEASAAAAGRRGG